MSRVETFIDYLHRFMGCLLLYSGLAGVLDPVFGMSHNILLPWGLPHTHLL